jgi:hypothetical protein
MIFIAIVIFGILTLLAKPENKLAVVITSSAISPDELPQIKGYYLYLSDGKEMKEVIDKNGWGYNFDGEYIQEVLVQKIAGEGTYQLFIIENDSLIYESGTVVTADTVIYKKINK